MDVVSKLTNVEKVTFDVRTGTIIPPVWETINGSSSIVKFVSRINGSIVTIEGVNPGTIKVDIMVYGVKLQSLNNNIIFGRLKREKA